MNLLEHWHLRERPFEATWDTRFFFSSADHEEALNRLIYLVEEGSMNLGLLSGEIGCGKTLTRAVFAARLNPARFQVVTLENSSFGFSDLLGAILHQLESDTPMARPRTTKFSRCQRFESRVRALDQVGRHLVVLLDEAQDLSAAALHELRSLTNLNGHGRAFLTVILIGQPELRAKVAKDRAINQRITLRFHLRPLGPDDVAHYLTHRLRAAGHDGPPLFTDTAARAIHAATQGVPREVNRLAKLCLEHAWLTNASRVEPSSIQTVVADLERHQSLPIL
jgi:general secretion pathway protein A